MSVNPSWLSLVVMGRILQCLAWGIVSAGLLSGCAPSTPAKPAASKDAPSLAQLVTEVESHATAIQAAFEKNDPAAADGPLHEVGHAIGAIPAAAQAAGLSSTALTDVQTAIDELMSAFGTLHDTMHVEEEPAGEEHAGEEHAGTAKFAELSDKIQASLEQLKKATTSS